MCQSNIFIDIGNSAVKWRNHETEVFSQNIDTFSLKLLPKADTVWVSAVAHTNILEAIQTKYTIVKEVHSLKQSGKLTLAYKDSSKLGVDRFLAMLGALEHFPNDHLLIIDVGSAVTFDVINNKGEHQGGLIMPGLKALRESFSKFSTNNLALKSTSLKTNTEEAWQSGTHAMLISSINNQIQDYESKHPNGEVLICGGIVKEVLSELPNTINYYNNLVLDGLESYSKSMG
jgi:type III pantothenate kinase